MKSVLEDDDLVKFLVEPDHFRHACAIIEKIDDAKTLLQGRFWGALQVRVQAEVVANGLCADLSDDWHRNPRKNYVGIEVSRPESEALKLFIGQASDQLYFSVLWPGRRPRNDQDVLLQRDDIRKFREDLYDHYRVRLEEPDRHQLGFLWLEYHLRTDETAEILSHNVENLVSDVMIDFREYYQICDPHLHIIKF